VVTRSAPGMVSLVAELRGHERQAPEELERWKTRVEERRVVDASPAAITLALLLTDEELDSLEKTAGDGEIAIGGRPRWIRCRKPSTGLRAMVSLPKSSRQCRGRRRATAVGKRDQARSPPRSAAATRASQRSDSAGIACAPASR
jgi:hypothetical protein